MFGCIRQKKSNNQKVKNQKVYFSTFLLLSHLSTFRLFEIKIYPFLRFDFSTFRLFVFRLLDIKNNPLLTFRLFDFRNSKRNLSTFRLFVFRLFEIEFTYFPPGTLQRVFPTQLVPPCLPIVSLFPLSPSLSPSLSPNLSPILFPSLSLSGKFYCGPYFFCYPWLKQRATISNLRLDCPEPTCVFPGIWMHNGVVFSIAAFVLFDRRQQDADV